MMVLSEEITYQEHDEDRCTNHRKDSVYFKEGTAHEEHDDGSASSAPGRFVSARVFSPMGRDDRVSDSTFFYLILRYRSRVLD